MYASKECLHASLEENETAGMDVCAWSNWMQLELEPDVGLWSSKPHTTRGRWCASLPGEGARHASEALNYASCMKIQGLRTRLLPYISIEFGQSLVHFRSRAQLFLSILSRGFFKIDQILKIIKLLNVKRTS